VLVTKSGEVFNHNKSENLIVTFTPVFAVLNNLAGLAYYFLGDIVVKLNALVYLFIKLSEKLHLYDAQIIFLKLDVSCELICLSKVLDLLDVVEMDNLLMHQVRALIQALLDVPLE
jgi:hypothetical protein